MLKTTVGRLLVNQALPEDLRDYSLVLDKKGIRALLRKVAEKHPDKYRDILFKLQKIGAVSAYYSGGFSTGIEDLIEFPETIKLKEKLKQELYSIYTNPNLDDTTRNKKISDLLIKAMDKLDDEVFNIYLRTRNPLALQVLSGARGNKLQLRRMLVGDLLYGDHNGNPVPVPILNSYAAGLSPVEYYASSFGVRKGLIDNKLCLADGTLIKLTNGSTEKIEYVSKGQLVLGVDKKGNLTPAKVINLYRNGWRWCNEYIFRSELSDNSGIVSTTIFSISATKDHKILAKVGDSLQEVPLDEVVNNKYKIVHVEKETEKLNFAELDKVIPLGYCLTFDLEIEHPDHLFLLDCGAVVSNSTQEAGFMSKQLNQVAHRLIVTKLDADNDDDTVRGLPVDTNDPDNIGALLAHQVGKYPKNTVLTARILSDLENAGIKKILVRSPAVRTAPDGGLYARDLGVRERGGLPPIGDFVGIAAAQAISEPLSQGQLNSRHSGGVFGASKATSGFKLVNQMVQVPAHYPGGATHATVDGKVTNIVQAPQGGFFVYVNNQQHYVPANMQITVKKGDFVEAGDLLSDGLANPAMYVKYKGIGEGRRAFIENLRKVLSDSGINANRRNIEVLATAVVNHVVATDHFGENLPGDTINYNILEHAYQPREGFQKLSVDKAANMFLEKPVLHYSIGTKVRPSVIKTLKDYGINEIYVHKDPPPFEPQMIRVMESLSHDPDWMTRFLGSYLKSGLLEGTHVGAESNIAGTSYVPPLAVATPFGRTGAVVGWKYDKSDLKKIQPPRNPPDMVLDPEEEKRRHTWKSVLEEI